jgi:hypothetical protein
LSVASSCSPGVYGSGFATTVADTTDVAVVAGNKILCRVSWWGGSGGNLTGVSGGSLTWTVDEPGPTGTGYRTAIISADAPAGLSSGTTITATFSVSSEARSIRLFQADGLATGTADGTGNLPHQTGTSFSIPVTVGTTGDFVFAVGWIDFSTAGATWTSPAVEVVDWANSDGGGFTTAYKTGVAPGAQTMAGTIGGNDFTGAAAAYKVSAGGGGGGTVDAWTPMRPGFMVGAAFPQFMWAFSAPFSSDSTAAPVAASGTGDLTLSASGVAAATAGGTGSLTFGASGSAAAPAAGTGSLSLSGTGTAQVTAAGTGSLTLSATGTATAPATGTGSITFSATGTAAAQGAASGTGSITLSATGSTTSPAAGTGSITFSATGTATGGGQATGTGSITLSATGAATSPSSGTGAISLSATGTPASRAAGSASLTLSGTGTASLGSGGTGTLTLVGAGTGRAVTVSTASLTLAAAGAIAATAGGTAQLVLSATGTGSGPITADPYPINIAIREERHTATLREATHTATLTAEPTQATLKASASSATIRES